VVDRTIGSYQLLEKLGEGGMGVVYKAKDTRLNRFVAIKALPLEKAVDEERLARFLQEARAASTLTHPNIVTLYDVVTDNGSDFIVMEYVAGELLAAKIARKELRLPQILKLGAQIADALGCAHAAGIVHRDLKPQNIMVAADGTAKVLDFGLAKLQPAVVSSDEATATVVKTGDGLVIGTMGYMSPEQVRGREVDHRSDIFTFGLVLYEMLAGTRAFTGESSIEVMNAIIKDSPAPLPAWVPPPLRQIVDRCLEKEPQHRFESARDLAFALRTYAAGSATSTTLAVAPVKPPARWLLPVTTAVALTLAALSVLLYAGRGGPDLSGLKFRPIATDAEEEDLGSWSPDGKSITYLKKIDGRYQVMIRDLSVPVPRQLTTIESGASAVGAPVFSPDGEWVYFVANLPGQSPTLWSVAAAAGGEPREVLRNAGSGYAISPDGGTLALWKKYEESGTEYSGVWISSPLGTAPRKYEPAPFRAGGSWVPNFLHFSPDGSRIVVSTLRVPGEPWIWSLPWPDGPSAQPRRLFPNLSFDGVHGIVWAPDSRHLVLPVDGDLWLGDPRSGSIERLTAAATEDARHPSVAPGGDRILFTTFVDDYDIVEIPLDGSLPKALVATSCDERSPSWSAAGDKMAYITDRSGVSEIWLRSVGGVWDRPIVQQSDFPDDPDRSFSLLSLSPDGNRVVYSRHGRVWISPTSGGKSSKAVVGEESGMSGISWSPDSASIAYIADSGKKQVAIMRIGSAEPQQVIPGMTGKCESAPVWSPNNEWIACGTKQKVLLVSWPDGKTIKEWDAPVPISNSYSVLVWSKDSARIYVASSSRPPARLDAIDVRTGDSRTVVKYEQDLLFTVGYTYSLTGSLFRDGNSLATTIRKRKSDLWILEGLKMPKRRWPF
jgi:serine/threonine protein kinase/Tol biopolymer transport system component